MTTGIDETATSPQLYTTAHARQRILIMTSQPYVSTSRDNNEQISPNISSHTTASSRLSATAEASVTESGIGRFKNPTMMTSQQTCTTSLRTTISHHLNSSYRAVPGQPPSTLDMTSFNVPRHNLNTIYRSSSRMNNKFADSEMST